MERIRMIGSNRHSKWTAAVVFSALILLSGTSQAITQQEMDKITERSNEAVKKFEAKLPQGKEFLKSGKGYLVMPALYKGGFIGGAEYGKGVLRQPGRPDGFYNFAALSFGLQAGGEKTSMIMVFNSDEALEKFRKNPGFEVGVDGSVTLITVGEKGSFDSTKAGEPIVAFIFGQRGLMAGASLKGAKFTKLEME